MPLRCGESDKKFSPKTKGRYPVADAFFRMRCGSMNDTAQPFQGSAFFIIHLGKVGIYIR